MPFKCLLYYSSDFNHLWRNGFLSFKLLLCCLFSFYLHVWDSPTQRLLHTIFSFTCSRICRENLPWLFDAGICRENLPQEFAVAICRENLSQEFAVGILPVVRVSKSVFLHASKSCLYESKPFLYVNKTFLWDFLC